MALQASNQQKLIIASGGGSLTPPAGHSYRIRNIHCLPSTNDTYLTLSVGGTWINKIRVKTKSGNHLPFPGVNTVAATEFKLGTIFDFARLLGAPLDIPIVSGEVFTVARYAEAGVVLVVYDDYDAADVKATEDNGSQTMTRRYMHYFGNTAQIVTTTNTTWTSLLTVGIDTWPLSLVGVNDKTVFRLLALLGTPCAVGSSSNKGYTDRLKLVQEQTTLFDPDGNGLMFTGDVANTSTLAYTPISSVIGAGTAENPARPLVFTPPLLFNGGDTLSMTLTTPGGTTGGIAANGVDLAFLQEVKRVA